MSRPMRRSAKRRSRPPTEDAGSMSDAFKKLFDIGPYHRNELSMKQIDRLRDLIDTEGLPRASHKIGVDQTTLLRVCAGFGHRLRPGTAAKVREYFGG